jgi:hypothetical protein
MNIAALCVTACAAFAFSGGSGLCEETAFVCGLHDTAGSMFGYAFGPNDESSFVEKVFAKEGKITFSVVGRRPVWKIQLVPGGMVLLPQNDPGWSLSIIHWNATLRQGKKIAGMGHCSLSGEKPSEDLGL